MPDINPQESENALNPKEATLAAELFLEKMRGLTTPITQQVMGDTLAACQATVQAHRNILHRLEEFKKLLGAKEPSKELVLTAINSGVFPNTVETMKKTEKYYLRFFVGGTPSNHSKASRKTKPAASLEGPPADEVA